LNKINENWDLFEHKTKIRTYLKKLDENWDQKGILTYYFLGKINILKNHIIFAHLVKFTVLGRTL